MQSFEEYRKSLEHHPKCNWDVDCVGDPPQYVTVNCTCAELEDCQAELIGADECRCALCIENMVDQAEYMRDSMID